MNLCTVIVPLGLKKRKTRKKGPGKDLAVNCLIQGEETKGEAFVQYGVLHIQFTCPPRLCRNVFRIKVIKCVVWY